MQPGTGWPSASGDGKERGGEGARDWAARPYSALGRLVTSEGPRAISAPPCPPCLPQAPRGWAVTAAWTSPSAHPQATQTQPPRLLSSTSPSPGL